MSQLENQALPPCTAEVNGCPDHSPTPELRAQVCALGSGGVTHGYIAKFLGISSRALRNHYYPELAGAAVYWAENYSPLSAKKSSIRGGVHVAQ
jgi:hypothetical protein